MENKQTDKKQIGCCKKLITGYKCGQVSKEFGLHYCFKCQPKGRKQNLGEKITPEQLHKWYLKAITYIDEESFNSKAQKDYKDLTEQQRWIDEYIANEISKVFKTFSQKLKEFGETPSTKRFNYKYWLELINKLAGDELK